MFKNTASQKIVFYAFLSTSNAPQTGDAANITAYVSIDGGAVTVLGDTSASELSSTNAKGSYQFDLTQAETNGDTLLFSAKSSTANVVLIPVLLQTFPSCFGIAGGAAGGPLIAGNNVATTFTAGLTITQSVANTPALVITGNGTGNGATISGGAGSSSHALALIAASVGGSGLRVTATSGDAISAAASVSGHGISTTATGTTKHGIHAAGGTISSQGINAVGGGTGAGILATAGATGIGFSIVGGSSSGNGVNITTTSGHGINIAPVGSSKHGILVTGGNSGTSDGVSLVAGTGGVGFRAGSWTITGAAVISGTATFNAVIVSGNFSIADGLTIPSPSTANRPAIEITGNGSAEAILATGGNSAPAAVSLVGIGNGVGLYATGATIQSSGVGLSILSGGNNPSIYIAGNGSGQGVLIEAGATGNAIEITAGATSGSGIYINIPGSGDGVDIINPTGFGVLVDAANGAINITGDVLINGASTTTGATTIGGAFTAANAGNDIRLGGTERVNIAAAVWDYLTAAMTTVGSIGKALVQTITGSGGAANFTVTVTDGTNPLQSVDFSLFNGSSLIARGTTDVNGNFTGSGPLGSFEVALYLGNHTFGGATRTITGNHTGTLESQDLVMGIITPAVPPADPSLCTVYGWLVDSAGDPISGVVVTIQGVPQNEVQAPLVTLGGGVVTLDPATGTSDINGYVEISVIQSDQIVPQLTYSISSSNGQVNKSNVRLDGTTQNLATL